MGILHKIIPDGMLTLPSYAIEITDTLKDDLFTVAELEDIISRDPTLSARVFKIANSSSFGPAEPIQTLSRAIIYLGATFIHALALSIPLLDFIKHNKPRDSFQWESYWKHSFACAYACFNSTKVTRYSGTMQEAFVVGYLHDIGKPILWFSPKGDYYKVIKEARLQGRDLLEVEREIYGTDHAEVSGEVVGLWNFPQRIALPIACHHDLIIEHPDVFTIQLGDCISNAIKFADVTRTERDLPKMSNQVAGFLMDSRVNNLVRQLESQSGDIDALVQCL